MSTHILAIEIRIQFTCTGTMTVYQWDQGEPSCLDVIFRKKNYNFGREIRIQNNVVTFRCNVYYTLRLKSLHCRVCTVCEGNASTSTEDHS